MPQNKNNKKGQVNIAQKKAGGKTASSGKKKPSKQSKTVIIVILATIIIAMLIFLIVGGVMVYQAAFSPKSKVKEISDMTSHTKTPSEHRDKVAYYVVGLLGEETEDPTEMLSILCWDKEKNTMSILQLPQDTYLGTSGQWAVKRAADVFGKPKELDWCISCRRPLKPEEISDGKHSLDGTRISKMPGSASEDLCGVFNHLLGLPVDGYFLFPQQGLVKLVNLLGGVDVSLEKAISVNDISYKKGVQTLDGDAALYYTLNKSSGISGDIDRLVKQRKVFIALFQRLARQSKQRLTNDFLGPLMNGSTPLRTDFSRGNLISLMSEMSDIQPSAMTAYILPGRTGRTGGKTYYAPHKSSLLQLLNQAFNPYGDEITQDSLPALTELGSGNPMDMRKQVMSDLVVEQAGAVTTTKEATTTTAK